MHENLSVGEFTRTIEALKDDVLRPGFERVNDRLDKLNSKTATHAEALAAYAQRFSGLDREIKELKTAPRLRAMKGGALVPEGMSGSKVTGYAAGAVGLAGVGMTVVDRVLTFLWGKLEAFIQ